ncbi:MAG TPA: hypothetical protein VHC92_01465 [Rhodanobacteraceae bacterium]|jgi:hypothetical protein|nr:hypothetical protein [Rhodanobacteraceae bacterium]
MYRHVALRAAAFASLTFAFHYAHAVSMNPHGIGEALIYPYYTVNKNQDTLISVVNPGSVGKAVQVRFREGYNGRDVRSFVLYLAPHDVWTASMSPGVDGIGAMLKTSDKSCTTPLFPAEGVELTSAGYDGTSPPYPADAGPQNLTRTQEGSIEFIVGGDIIPGSATEAATTRTASGAPSCAGLTPMNTADLGPANSGIFGSASIVNVGEGTFFSYNADALQNFSSRNLFFYTLPLGPTLADASSPESKLGGAVAYVTGYGEYPAALDYESGIDAVSAVLMADAIYGEYFVDAGFGANTDWIVSFPTKNYYVDKVLYPSNPTAPFEESFSAPGESGVSIGGTVCDRDQSCQTIAATRVLPYQVNTIPIRSGGGNDPSGVFGSNQLSLTITPRASAGDIKLDLSADHALVGGQYLVKDHTPMLLTGLPVLGFMAYDIVNANAQNGVLANYGGTFPLRKPIACEGLADTCDL